MHNFNPIWDSLPAATRWQIDQRNKLQPGKFKNHFKLNQGINYSIILNSACIIEGILDFLSRSLIIQKSSFNKSNLTELDQIIINTFLDGISNTTWSKYNSLIKLINKSSLKEYLDKIDQNLYTQVEHLFKYRNILAHGQSLTMKLIFSETDKLEVDDVQFEKVFEEMIIYLRKYNLSEQKFPKGAFFTSIFFTNEIADHFFMVAETFALNIEKMFGSDTPYNLTIGYVSPLFKASYQI